MLFRPVRRLPLQGGHVHAWGDKYTHTHSLWWENIVSESTSYICYIFLYTLYHHEILSDPGVGPALEYSSLPSIVNLSCSVRQVINTNNNTMKVIIWKFANEQELWDLLQVFPEPRLSLSWYSEPDPSFPSYIDLWVSSFKVCLQLFLSSVDTGARMLWMVTFTFHRCRLIQVTLTFSQMPPNQVTYRGHHNHHREERSSLRCHGNR